MTDSSSLPEPLRRLADDPRVQVRRRGAPASHAKCVVYWMQRAQRGIDNPALDCAIGVANELGLPLVAFFSAISNFPRANLRHYAFLNQGLHDAEHDLAERGVPLIVRRPPENKLEPFLEEVGAGILIGDENPLREPERWRKVLAGRLKIPFWTVDADVIVPAQLFTKGFYAQHLFRRQLDPLLPEYLVEPIAAKLEKQWSSHRIVRWQLDDDITRGWQRFNRSVKPVDTFRGGTHTAMQRLRYFVEHQLAEYEMARRKPQINGTSQLSPYLHFGHISPLRIALEVRRAADVGKAPQSAYDAYISELIGWRELAVNFVIHSRNTYDTIECAEPWAEKTLREHARDRREYEYTCEQLERGETHDALWNAAQLQMVRYGWMHNILRMYWAKKILEWAPNPARAFEWAVLLNDTYELDGRDPNSYAGIAWAIAGKFDRPWFEREIFGTIRYMSGASTGKKFDAKLYMALVANPEMAKEQLFATVTRVG
ncbi:MAG: deoxyribodipyrimidine photo-lyase [Acidobacteriaceae bacterium]